MAPRCRPPRMSASKSGPTRDFGGHKKVTASAHGAASRRARSLTAAAAAEVAESESSEPAVTDRFIRDALKMAPEIPDGVKGLAQLRASSQHELQGIRMPSTRTEEYRYTDISPILRTPLQMAPAGTEVAAAVVEARPLEAAREARVVVVDGVFRPELSCMTGIPEEVYIGPLSEAAPDKAAAFLGQPSSSRGGPFCRLNGAMATSVLVIAVPEGLAMPGPIHILYLSSDAEDSSQASCSAPRLLFVGGAGSCAEVVEEFAAASVSPSGAYLCNSVAEFELGEDAELKHCYVEEEAANAWHLRSSLVQQAARSRYQCVEVALGGKLTRHDLQIQQLGEETETQLGHFVLCSSSQLHDVHTSLLLDHPRGMADQLHKCIVSAASGRGVFDGNVQVQQRAQQTDAGQLSRNLLLVPKATVNVKPNLQIVADDVKCTHGCAVSDLSADEIFYFQSRGISREEARKSLVFSFGAEVVQKVGHDDIVKRLQRSIAAALSSSPAILA